MEGTKANVSIVLSVVYRMCGYVGETRPDPEDK